MGTISQEKLKEIRAKKGFAVVCKQCGEIDSYRKYSEIDDSGDIYEIQKCLAYENEEIIGVR